MKRTLCCYSQTMRTVIDTFYFSLKILKCGFFIIGDKYYLFDNKLICVSVSNCQVKRYKKLE